MDHSYFTERDRLQKTDHCYFTVAKKTPKVVLRRAQLLKEQQDVSRSPIGQDHSYVRCDHLPHMSSADDISLQGDHFLQLTGLSESLVSVSESLSRSYDCGRRDDFTCQNTMNDAPVRASRFGSVPECPHHVRSTWDSKMCLCSARIVMMSSEHVPNSQAYPVISRYAGCAAQQPMMSPQHSLTHQQELMTSSVSASSDCGSNAEAFAGAVKGTHEDVDRMINGVELDHAYDATIDVAVPCSTYASRRKPWSFSDDFRITGRKPWSFSDDFHITGRKPWSFSDDFRITGRKPWSFSDDSRITGRLSDVATSATDDLVTYQSCSRLDDHTYLGSLVSPTA